MKRRRSENATATPARVRANCSNGDTNAVVTAVPPRRRRFLLVFFNWADRGGAPSFHVGLYSSMRRAVHGLRAATWDSVDSHRGYKFTLQSAIWVAPGAACQDIAWERAEVVLRRLTTQQLPSALASAAGDNDVLSQCYNSSDSEEDVPARRGGGRNTTESGAKPAMWSVELGLECRRPGVGAEISVFPEPDAADVLTGPAFLNNYGMSAFYVLRMNEAARFDGGDDGSEWRRRLRMTWLAAVVGTTRGKTL